MRLVILIPAVVMLIIGATQTASADDMVNRDNEGITIAEIAANYDDEEIIAPTLEERMEYLGLIVPEEVKKRFEELDMLPPPAILDERNRLDWREMGGVTPVKNQGACGSCWDFAATGAFESAILIETGMELDLSEQQVLSCNDGYSNCNGGWMEDAYDLFADYGAVEESCMPYEADDDVPCYQDECEVVAVLDSVIDIPNNVNAIKNALLDGPVSTTFTVYSGFQWNCYWHADTDPINHAVVIVGWDDSLCDTGGWIVKNSWGEWWGDDGYFYMPYGSCGIGHYTQQPFYHLETRPHHRTVLDRGWDFPESLGPVVNTESKEAGVFISDDGEVLVFHSDRIGGSGGKDLWMSVWDDTGWGLPVNMGSLINCAYADENPCLSQGGDTLYFSSRRPGGEGGYDIWMSVLDDGEWTSPTNLGSEVNSQYNENGPEKHGSYLYFHSNRTGGYGGTDIWRANQSIGGDWENAVNLGPEVNTSFDERGPSVSYSGTILYFSSDRPGGFGDDDLWESEWRIDEWTTPVNLGSSVNSSFLDATPCITPGGDALYFSSDRDGGNGNTDLWMSLRSE